MKTQAIPSNSKLPFIVFSLFLLSYAALLLPAQTHLRLTDEDNFFENLTALFFFIAAVVFMLLFINERFLKSTDLRSTYSSKAKRYVFLIFALVFSFGFLEEISWGQRIFNFQTPEFMNEVNSQGEFNIHNLELFDGKDVSGTPKGTLQKLFTMKQMFLYTFFTYLFILPLLVRYQAKIRELCSRCYIPVPPFWLGIMFLMNFIVYGILRFKITGGDNQALFHSLNEIQEFNFSIVLLLLPFSWIKIPKIGILNPQLR